jgi:hypothetical protein
MIDRQKQSLVTKNTEWAIVARVVFVTSPTVFLSHVRQELTIRLMRSSIPVGELCHLVKLTATVAIEYEQEHFHLFSLSNLHERNASKINFIRQSGQFHLRYQ